MGWMDSGYEGERLGQQIKIGLLIFACSCCVLILLILVNCFSEQISAAIDIVFSCPLWVKEWILWAK